MIEVKTNQEVEKTIIHLLKNGAKSCEVVHNQENTFSLIPSPSQEPEGTEGNVGYGVFYKFRGWSPEDVYVREIKFDKTFNWRFAYWEREVYALEEDAQKRTQERIREFLEEWAEEGNASPFWHIGGVSGKLFSPPDWWEAFGYGAVPYFWEGYHSGWYWKPVKKA